MAVAHGISVERRESRLLMLFSRRQQTQLGEEKGTRESCAGGVPVRLSRKKKGVVRRWGAIHRFAPFSALISHANSLAIAQRTARCWPHRTRASSAGAGLEA